jgi:DNA ligase-associated metallophosphoesterase
MTEVISIQNNTFIMHNSGALFWKEKSMLIISDVHLGKVSHFRKFGSAVPQNAIHKNFELLTSIVDEFTPQHICFLGDLFHSSMNSEWKLFEQWVSTIQSQILLVVGNHDIISPKKYEGLHIKLALELVIENFLLTHHPEEREGFYNFSGHIHPAIKLRGLGRQVLKLPCFYYYKTQMILPAFGEFTGTFTLQPTTDHQVFVISKDEIYRVAMAE